MTSLRNCSRVTALTFLFEPPHISRIPHTCTMLTRPTLAIPPRIRAAQMFAGQRRLRSNSPYGRSHLPDKQKRAFPAPVVPHYPQLVFSSDGSTFTQYTTSPVGEYKMARDIHNNSLYYPGQDKLRGLDESEIGRMGRFKRKFAGVNQGEAEPGEEGQQGGNLFKEGEMGWLAEIGEEWGDKPAKEKAKK
ncbi:hypothetical protein CALVIDRAFT_396608 [Calocera viscosa TUFC12733]|uniref:Uncharacterized protein n=1 Tax=Calocera viscosa (strain TUFC12733) TaxID=1330018 RepID=A0A167PPJ2_CALVF|nr:hypothetical protein CALVIDRAFT_396608 [Calocera viscosa TUFC12733]